jgi:hypothetical protein
LYYWSPATLFGGHRRSWTAHRKTGFLVFRLSLTERRRIVAFLTWRQALYDLTVVDDPQIP